MISAESPVYMYSGGERYISKVKLVQEDNAKDNAKATFNCTDRPPGHYAIINRWSQVDKAFSLTLTIP